jgi:hypothetical protein
LRDVHAHCAELPRMGAVARDIVAAEHSWPARVRDMLPALRSALAARHGRGTAAPALPALSRS